MLIYKALYVYISLYIELEVTVKDLDHFHYCVQTFLCDAHF